jgi:hypothetical protein
MNRRKVLTAALLASNLALLVATSKARSPQFTDTIDLGAFVLSGDDGLLPIDGEITLSGALAKQVDEIGVIVRINGPAIEDIDGRLALYVLPEAAADADPQVLGEPVDLGFLEFAAGGNTVVATTLEGQVTYDGGRQPFHLLVAFEGEGAMDVEVDLEARVQVDENLDEGSITIEVF